MKIIIKRIGTLLLTLFLGVCFALHCEATVYNSDGSAADVQALHNAALNGDTITLPVGTFTWTTGVTITKAIQIQGAGSGRIIGRTLTSNTVGTGSKTFTTQSGLSITTGQTLRIVRRIIQTDSGDVSGTFMLGTVTSYSGTTLVMNITSTGGSGTYAAWYIATEPLTTVNYTPSSGTAFSITPSSGNIEFSGIKCIAPPGAGGTAYMIYINDAFPHETIIHDCWFKAQPSAQAIKAATNSVLIYNCSFDSPFSSVEAIAMKWENTQGNTSWTTADTLGDRDTNGNKNFYIEDCDFHYFLNATNFDSNSRVVVRHCTLDNAGLGTHGGDSSPIGVRHWEVYDSRFILEPTTNGVVLNVCYWVWIRGGTGIVLDNNMDRIISQDWSHKHCVHMMCMNIRLGSDCGNNCYGGGYPIGPYKCWTTYPIPHAPGQGNDGSSQTMLVGDFTDPIRIWNNTGPVDDGTDVNLGQYEPDNCGNGLVADFATQRNRDYFFSTDATAARPGYNKFTYPHPLRSDPPPTPTPAPTSTPTPTASPTPTPTPTPTPAARAQVADFNGDGHPDFVVQNPFTHQTAIWYMNNNVFIGGAYGPTLAAGWGLRSAADFDRDSHLDYALFAPNTYQTAIWYLSGPTLIGAAYGPTLPAGWELVATADFNGDGYPDYVLYIASTGQTVIAYLNNTVVVGGAFGPTLPAGWALVATADFDGDGHPDFVVQNPFTHQTAIWYMNNNVFIVGAYGPTLAAGWALVATADFDGDGHPDYLLYNAATGQTEIWYLNNNVFVSTAFGPTLPAGWSLVGP